MDEREQAAEEAQGNEGRSSPDEEQVNTDGADDDDDDEDDRNFSRMWAEINKPGPSGTSSASASTSGYLCVPSVRITESNDTSSDTYDISEPEVESPEPDFGYHRYYYFPSGSSHSGALERRIPPTESEFLELCRSELPKSEGRMAAYVKRLRRERDRTLALINEMRATLLSLRDLLVNPPERQSSRTNWRENFETYNVDPSLGINNKMKYYVVVTDRQVYFIQSDGIRFFPANGYIFDGVTLSRRLDLPSTSKGLRRRRIDLGGGGFTFRHHSSTDSRPSSSSNSAGSSDENMPGSGQAIPEGENPIEIISPLKSSSSGQLRSTNASGKMEKRSTSRQASTNDNQSESVPRDTHDSSTNKSTRGPKSNRDASTNKKLARQSRSNQDSSTNNQLAKGSRSNRDSSTNKKLARQSRSNQDSSTNNQLERQNRNNLDNSTNEQLKRGSRKNQDSSTSNLNPTGIDSLAIPGPSNRDVQLEATGSFNSEHSYSINPSDPGPSGINQNEDYIAYTNNSGTANVGASGTLLMGPPLIASPQVPSAIHSNQSFYSTATGNTCVGASTGSNTVSSYSATNYSDGRISYAYDNTQIGRHFLMPNQVSVDENVAYSADPIYYSSENYGMVNEHAGGNGSSNASVNTYPAAASGIMSNSAGVQSFHPMNVYSQDDTSGGNIVQSYPSSPHTGYIPLTPITYDNIQNNIQSYGSDSVNEYPHVSVHEYPHVSVQRYGYGQPYRGNNSMVYNSTVATLNPYVPQETHNIPNTVVYGPMMVPQVQNVMGMNATQGGMHPFAPSGEAFGPPSNIYPHASGGMYNSMSNENNAVQIYFQNSWQNPPVHTVIYSSGNLAPGISNLGVQGHDAQFISHEEVVNNREPENLVSPEGNHDEGSARTRGFTNAIPQTSDQHYDSPDSNPTQANITEVDAVERRDTNEGSTRTNIARAGSSAGGSSAQTSASRGEKSKINAHKRASQSSGPGESSAKQSASEGRKNHGKGKFQASTSRERAPEVTTSDRASRSANRGKTFQLEPSGGNAPEISVTEGALSNIHRSITHNVSDRKKDEERVTQDNDFGIRTRSKTRELNRKEAEKSSLTGVGAATGVERRNLRSTTTRSASKTAGEASFSEATERKRAKTSDLSEIPSNTRILRAKQGNKSRLPPGEGTLSQVSTKIKIKPDTLLPASDVGPSVLPLEPGPSGTSGGGISREASEEVSAAGAAVKTSVSGIVEEECAPEVETGKGKASETLTKAAASGVSSNVPATSGKFTKTKTGVHHAKGKVSEKSYHKPTNQTDSSSEEIPGGRDLRATDKRKDLPGDPPTPGKNIWTIPAVASTQTLEAMPSMSVQKRKWIPATTVFKPLTIRENEANTSFNVIKSSRPRTLVIKRETPSSILTGSRIPNPVLMLHKEAEKKSDLEQRNGNEVTLMRIQQVEQNLARYRNEYNNILKLLSVIDDYIIEAPLYIENLTPQID